MVETVFNTLLGQGMKEMAKCQVCGREIAESMEDPVGQTSSGAKEIDPTKGTKRFRGGQWYYFDSLACRSRFEASPDEFI